MLTVVHSEFICGFRFENGPKFIQISNHKDHDCTFIYLSLSTKHSAEGRVWVWRAYTQIATILFLNFFCKQMAVVRSIFTLDGGFQLFCAAFDMAMTGIPLEVALGYKIFFFWLFQKIIMDSHLCYTCMIIFLKCPKIKFLPS